MKRYSRYWTFLSLFDAIAGSVGLFDVIKMGGTAYSYWLITVFIQCKWPLLFVIILIDAVNLLCLVSFLNMGKNA